MGDDQKGLVIISEPTMGHILNLHFYFAYLFTFNIFISKLSTHFGFIFTKFVKGGPTPFAPLIFHACARAVTLARHFHEMQLATFTVSVVLYSVS